MLNFIAAFFIFIAVCDAFMHRLAPFHPPSINDKCGLLSKDNQGALGSAQGILPDGGISPCVIKVIGVGGGGGNAVMRMIETGVSGVDFIAINTDLQALTRFGNRAQTLNIGKDVTRGLGAGGVPDNGRKAAEESRAEILKMVTGSDLIFITAGMGGGTGSGAAPVVAEIAREAGALTVGVVTKPFGFEGRRRMQQALGAIERLREEVDTLIIVSNDRLLQIIPENTPLQRAFSVADDVLRQGVVGISEIIIRPGLINVDFADVRAIMGNAGTALMGIGRGSGRTRAQEAAAAAISSPLLDLPIEKARGVVFNIVGGNDLTLQEINAAAEVIYEAVDPNANIIFGALVDDSMEGEIAITVIATGFPLGKIESEEKLARMQQQVYSSSSGSVRTVGEAVRAQQIKQKQQHHIHRHEYEPSSRREKDRKMIYDVDMEENNGDVGDRLSITHRVDGGDRRRKHPSSSSTSSSISSNQVRTQKSPRIASTEDDDLPDFLSRLRRNR